MQILPNDRWASVLLPRSLQPASGSSSWSWLNGCTKPRSWTTAAGRDTQHSVTNGKSVHSSRIRTSAVWMQEFYLPPPPGVLPPKVLQVDHRQSLHHGLPGVQRLQTCNEGWHDKKKRKEKKETCNCQTFELSTFGLYTSRSTPKFQKKTGI